MRPRLLDADLALVKQWILDGGSLAAVGEALPDELKTAETLARVPDRPITREERLYWAFQPPQRAAVPVMPDRRWRANPIDAFLRAAMQVRKITPSPRADRRALIRRLYLDVLGLPPTPEEIEAFVAIALRMRGARLSIGCSRRHIMVNVGRVTGSIWCATPIRAGSSSTRSPRDVAIPGLRGALVQRRQALLAIVLEQLAGDELGLHCAETAATCD